MPTAAKDLNRHLLIKTGSVNRYKKDIQSYGKELQQQLTKVQALKSAESCSHDIAQQIKVAEETEAMIQECTRKLEGALGDLQDFLGRHAPEEFEVARYEEGQKALKGSN